MECRHVEGNIQGSDLEGQNGGDRADTLSEKEDGRVRAGGTSVNYWPENEADINPPHYGTEDEDSQDTGLMARLPQRFRPLVDKVRSLLVQPPREWKYQVELDDDPDEKGVIERCSRELEAFQQAHALDPAAAPSGELERLVGDKAVAIADSLCQHRHLVAAWRILHKAFAKAPSHPRLLARYSRLLNFEVFEREQGRHVMEHAVQVAPDHPEVLVEHGSYQADRLGNISYALHEYQRALELQPRHRDTLVAVAHLLLRRNMTTEDAEEAGEDEEPQTDSREPRQDGISLSAYERESPNAASAGGNGAGCAGGGGEGEEKPARHTPKRAASRALTRASFAAATTTHPARLSASRCAESWGRRGGASGSGGGAAGGLGLSEDAQRVSRVGWLKSWCECVAAESVRVT